ncbi:GLPGLI family protein [Flavobacterium salilacus subsp. salilacus]|uniref:GLPGLI family protein n=1 Tax=Flavobacterium TaxID=237 RepID=UPI001074D788|nr:MULTISPECIES: GLPGLI family protein [Flavobacterium]KAF2520200.1 GLPGLI family protein [Flavobacterium salilacus subsp. salilacus]MBE1613883.1 GLPGLI family protein [Flavobacterium sp. SaA2.13]
MNKFFLIIILYCNLSLCLNAQNKENIQVEYQIFNNTDSPNTLFATLFTDKKITIFFEKYSTQAFDLENSEGVVTRKPLNLFEPYTKIDHINKKVFLFEPINSINYLVEDNYTKLEWEISDETKEIAAYECVKATTNFRGRKWVAWFTPEIPLPYGPWKFHGLPGLIIEAYDIEGVYTMRAVKIEFKRDNIFDKDFTKLYKTKNNEPISYKEFLKNYQEYLENTRAEIQSEMKHIKFLPTPPRKTKELKFEWEE